MPEKSKFPRTKGRLTAVSETQLDGRKAFVCECVCGRGGRTVLAKSFDRGRVTCCEQCVADGFSEAIDYGPERVFVSLDPDVFAALGIDLSLPENVSGALVRAVLRDYATVVGAVEGEVGLTGSEWERLKAVLRRRPNLLTVEGLATALDTIGRQFRVLKRAILLAKVRRELDSERATEADVGRVPAND